MSDAEWPENHDLFADSEVIVQLEERKPIAQWSFDPLFINYVVYTPHMPNRFQRWMQRVCLGIYWRKI